MSISYSKLRGRIVEKGYSISSLSAETGIPLSTLSNKLNGITEFKTSEIIIISKVLDIDDLEEYFFTLKVRDIEQDKALEINN